MSKVHCLSFLSFIQKIHKRPTYHWSKTTESGGKSHCEIKAFSSSCWPQLLQRPFSQDKSSEFSPVMPEEFGEHLIRDQRPFLHPESLQILQIHSSMLVLLLLSSPHSCSVGFRSEHWDSHGKRFICAQRPIFVFVGLLSWWKIQTWLITRFVTEAVRFWFCICWYLIESMMQCIWTRCPGPLAEKQATTLSIFNFAHEVLFIPVCSKLIWGFAAKRSFSVSSDHRSQSHLKVQLCLTTDFAGVFLLAKWGEFPWNPPEQHVVM